MHTLKRVLGACFGVVGILILSLSLPLYSVAASTRTIYYLHIPQCIQDISANPDDLTLDTHQGVYQGTTCPLMIPANSGAYVWMTSPSLSNTTYPAGQWELILWLNTTGTLTQYNVSLSITDHSGNTTQIGSAFTPAIASDIPAIYSMEIRAAANVTLNTGASLTLSLLNTDQQGNVTDAGFIFLDSTATPSRLIIPESNITEPGTSAGTVTQTSNVTSSSNSSLRYQSSTSTTKRQQTTTTTEVVTTTADLSQAGATEISAQSSFTSVAPAPSDIGLVLVIIGVGAGFSMVLGMIVLMLSRKPAESEITLYAGEFHCRKHRIPLVKVRGRFWCPIEGRYLKG